MSASATRCNGKQANTHAFAWAFVLNYHRGVGEQKRLGREDVVHEVVHGLNHDDENEQEIEAAVRSIPLVSYCTFRPVRLQ